MRYVKQFYSNMYSFGFEMFYSRKTDKVWVKNTMGMKMDERDIAFVRTHKAKFVRLLTDLGLFTNDDHM